MQFSGALAANGVQASFWPLLGDRYLGAKYGGRATAGQVVSCYLRRLRHWRSLSSRDLLWVEKELFPFVPYWLEAALLGGRRYVLDLDDAVFHSYDLSPSRLARSLLGCKIDRLMAGAAMVIAGNPYLALRARAAGQRRVEVLPSVVDLDRYPPPTDDRAEREPMTLRIVWIGSPATVRYLNLVRAPVMRLAQACSVELRVIGAQPPRWPGVCAVGVPWTLDGESSAIRACDVGVMPLADSPWERGKCGYKLIQYMACGLPVVASPVGVNAEIVEHGIDGFLAADDDQWVSTLTRLAADVDLRQAMGRRGRAKVEAGYSVQAVAPRLAALLKEAAG